MNNDASSSAAAADLPPPPTSSFPGPSNETADAVTGLSSPTPTNKKTPAQRKIQAQAQKKDEFLGGLLENLDSVIYMELCILYYMDNSLFRLLIRAVNQLMFLTPKPAFLPPAPQQRPFLGAIFVPNIICIILHILTARSEAGEAMRGYLHGGVIVDLIGQKGPTSKVHLVLLDLFVWALQCIMLTVLMEKEKVTKVLKELKSGPRLEVAVDGAQPRGAETVSAQDMDAEERGVLSHGITDTNSVELDNLDLRNDASPTRERSEEHEQLLAEPTLRSEEDENENPLDIFYSRTASLATFHVLPALRSQWEDYGTASGSALQTVGFSAEFARVAATRRLNAEARILQRPLNANR